MIITPTPITVMPVELNDRLWLLHRLSATGAATRVQLDELDRLCRTLEAGQDNRKANP